MALDIAGQIARLPSFSRQQLFNLWQELYGRAAPSGMRRELMVPFLAYRIQEKAYGGLAPSTRAELRRVSRSLEGKSVSARPLVRTQLKSGTSLLRRWKGEPHEVSVTDSGYEYRGAGYSSLSEIACKITGTRWSGPAFFGLNKTAPTKRALDG